MQENFEKYKYGYKATFNGKVVHICLYENHPTDNDFQNLVNELLSDEEFCLTKHQINQLSWKLIDGEELQKEIKLIKT